MIELWASSGLPGLAKACLGALLAASLAGGLAIALVALASGRWSRMPAATRSLLWWAASAKLLLLLGGLGLEVPVLPAAPANPSSGWPAELAERVAPALAPLAEVAAAEPADDLGSGFGAPSWWEALALLWLAGVVAGIAATARDLLRLRGLVRRATLVVDPWLEGRLAALARELLLGRAPRLLVSPEVAVPQVVGLLRPAILLPQASLGPVARGELEMVLAHELAHLARRDLVWGWVPWLAHRLFFFHPAASLAVREYHLAREAACDVLALELLGSAPREYGRMLIRWGVVLRETGLAAAAASPSARTLKRRLEMLAESNDGRGARTRRAWWWATAALMLLVPLQLVRAERGDAEGGGGGRGGAQHDGWAWVDKVDGSGSSMSFSGSFDDGQVRDLVKKHGAPLFLVRRSGEVFRVKDPAAIERLRAIFEPIQELGKKQGELGERQGELGERQGELGERQGELGERQGELGERLGELGEQMGELGETLAELEAERSRDNEAAIEAERTRIEAEMETLEDRMEALSKQLEGEDGQWAREQEELGRQQEELGRQQEALGKQQAELGRQQEALAKQAEVEIERLVEQALAAGSLEKVQ